METKLRLVISDPTGRYRVEDEVTGEYCGYDFESFVFGSLCEEPATVVIIQGADHHYAHLCAPHMAFTMVHLVED